MTREEFEHFTDNFIRDFETDHAGYLAHVVKKGMREAYNRALEDAKEATNDCDANWWIDCRLRELKISE